jgi:hypothetical protein
MPIHLSFLDAAAKAIVDGIRIHDAQFSRDEAGRDAYQLARAIDSVHLGTDKLLKHIVSAVDPYLLLKNPRPEVIRDIRGAILHGGASSMFTSGVRVETLDAEPMAKVIRDVIRPSIPDADMSAFIDALQAVVSLRNHVQHGELFGDSDRMLANLRRLLGGVYALGASVCPEFLRAVRELDGQAESRLKAYKDEIDGAWQVLLDYLAAHGSIALSISVDVWLPSADEPNRVLVSRRGYSGDRLSFMATVSDTHSHGLFRRLFPIGGSLGRALRRVSTDDLADDLGIDQTQPSKPRGILAALTEYVPPPRKAILPLDEGELRVESVLGQVSVHLPKLEKRSYLTANVLFSDFTVKLLGSEFVGSVRTVLLPARGTTRRTITVSGKIQLYGEYVLSEPDEKLDLPSGATWWALGGDVELAADS